MMGSLRLVVLVAVCSESLLHSALGGPLFFSNPFGTRRHSPDDDMENISIYTTSSPHDAESHTSVYFHLAKNVYERLTDPIYKLFNNPNNNVEISVTTTRTVVIGRRPIPTTTTKTTTTTTEKPKQDEKLELLGETTTVKDDNGNSTEFSKEEVDPKFVDGNPSFVERKDQKQPERLITSRMDFGNEIDSEVDEEDEDEDEDDFPFPPVIRGDSIDHKPRRNEVGIMLFLEYIASAVTLVMGAIDAFFGSRSN